MGSPEQHSPGAIESALAELSEPGRLEDAQRLVAQGAPQLQMILAQALEDGGWFDSAHTEAIRSALAESEPLARERAIRTLVAEETRVGMLIGVAVGLELFRILGDEQPDATDQPEED